MPFVESRLQVYNDTLIQRARSAVIVQKWWRAHRDLKKSKLNIIVEINRARAVIRLQRWARNITFRHRIRFNREYRFYEKTIHSNSFYLQIYIYMKLPPISDYLKINRLKQQEQSSLMLTESTEHPFKDLYELIHRDTRVKLIHKSDRQWLKIEFQSVADAKSRIKLLTLFTYRFYFNGHSLKLFTFEDIVNLNFTAYEHKVHKSFSN
jgi:hypothetical protein